MDRDLLKAYAEASQRIELADNRAEELVNEVSRHLEVMLRLQAATRFEEEPAQFLAVLYEYWDRTTEGDD